jgi:hypothetical protein
MTTTDVGVIAQPIPEAPSTAWVREFREEMLRLTVGEADEMQVADWAVLAYTTKFERNAAEVAREELEHGWPPIPE